MVLPLTPGLHEALPLPSLIDHRTRELAMNCPPAAWLQALLVAHDPHGLQSSVQHALRDLEFAGKFSATLCRTNHVIMSCTSINCGDDCHGFNSQAKRRIPTNVFWLPTGWPPNQLDNADRVGDCRLAFDKASTRLGQIGSVGVLHLQTFGSMPWGEHT